MGLGVDAGRFGLGLAAGLLRLGVRLGEDDGLLLVGFAVPYIS